MKTIAVPPNNNKVRCKKYFTKAGQWFNQNSEYSFTYAMTKSGNMRIHVSMGEGYDFIALTDKVFDSHFAILQNTITIK